MNLNELSLFYKSFSELEQSGLGYLQAFEVLKKTETNKFRFKQMEYMIQHLKLGRPLSQGLARLNFVPVFDIPLIVSGEESGKMVQIFNTLAKKYSDTAQAVKDLRGQLIRPFLTLLVALFIPSLPSLFSGKISFAVYLRNSLGILILFLLATYSLYDLWMRSYFEINKAKTLHSILSRIPFLKSLNRNIAIEKFSHSLSLMLSSGLNFFEASKHAALSSAAPEIANAIQRMIPLIDSGQNLTQVFEKEKYFPNDFNRAIQLGSESGKIPEFLDRYVLGLKEKIDTGTAVLIKSISIFITCLVMGYVAYAYIESYKNQMEEVEKVLKN